MKDREIVYMAYRLILGRYPESDTVLDRDFYDINSLRKQFINSPEFLYLFTQTLSLSSFIYIKVINFIK